MAKRLYTAKDLDRIEGDFELDRGVLVPVNVPRRPHGMMCSRLDRKIGNFVEAHDLGEVTCNDSGYILEEQPDTVRGPDVAFVRKCRLSGIHADEYFRGSPDLAVEILSAGDGPGEVKRKVSQYLAAGCSLVWVVDFIRKRVTVYRRNMEVETLRAPAVLDGGDVLPGFTWPLEDLFRGF